MQAPAGLSESLNLSPVTLRLLARRGIASPGEIQNFLYPSLDHLLDPFLLPGIRDSVGLIQKHLCAGSQILIHGDYDVDGVTASAILIRTFRKLGTDALAFLPHRIDHGYGLTESGVDFAKENNAKLVITVDCGIGAVKEIRELRSLGIDVIVTDHHQLPIELPDASAIIHPLVKGRLRSASPPPAPGMKPRAGTAAGPPGEPDRMDRACLIEPRMAACPSWPGAPSAVDETGIPFRNLCAAGLAYKLSQALLGDESFELLDLAALGTIADVVPLVRDNRLFIKFGLERLEAGSNIGLKALAAIAKARGKWSTHQLGFVLGPRINASGRMDTAHNALQLLVSENEKEAQSLARLLEEENKRRQRFQQEAVKEAIRKVESEVNFNRERIIVVWSKTWHPGVIGIVASRLMERFYRPSIVINLNEENIGRGSARSIKSFNIFQALKQASEYLIEYGGHEQAAGLKIHAKNLESFKQSINEAAFANMEPSSLIKSYDVDCEVAFSELSREFFADLELLEPFGLGNPKPIFLTKGLAIKGKPASFGKSGGLKFWLEDGETVLGAQWRSPKPFDWESCAEPVDVVYSPSLKIVDGQPFPLLEIKSLKLSQ